MKRILGATALALVLANVSACGLTGDLKRPGPLIGSGNNAEPAELPGAGGKDLPPLPERPAQAEPAEDEDELLGGPES